MTMIRAARDADVQLTFLRNLDDEFVACRQGHELPRLAPTRSGRLPKGIRAVGPYRNGVFDLKLTCASCGLEISMLTGARGAGVDASKPRRKYPHGYLAKGIGRIAPGLAREVGYERIADVLIATATPAETEEDSQ